MFDHKVIGDQTLAVLYTYAIKCAIDSRPLSPEYDRFIPIVCRSAMIPAYIYTIGPFTTLEEKLLRTVERAYRFAMFSIENPNCRFPHFMGYDSEYMRDLDRAIDHVDVFHRVAQHLPCRPYSSKKDVRYLQIHFLLITRPGAREPFEGNVALEDKEPLLSDLFDTGYFANKKHTSRELDAKKGGRSNA